MDTKQLNTELKLIVWKTKPLDSQESTNFSVTKHWTAKAVKNTMNPQHSNLDIHNFVLPLSSIHFFLAYGIS